MRLQREYIEKLRLYLANDDGYVGGDNFIDIALDSDAKLVKTAMSFDNSLTLNWSSTQKVKISKGSYAVYDGLKYTFLDDKDLEQHGERDYRYKVILRDAMALAKYTMLKNTSDDRLVFEFTGTLAEHLEIVIENLNQNQKDDRIWKSDYSIVHSSKKEMMIPYSYNYCSDAIQTIATQFDIEIYVEETENEIIIRSSYPKPAFPRVLKYGKNKGLRPGIKTTVDGPKVTKMYVTGGERNIDLSTYGHKSLQLPSMYFGRYFYNGEFHYVLYKEYDSKENFSREVLYKWDNESASLVEVESSTTEDGIDVSSMTEYIRPVSSNFIMREKDVHNPSEIDVESYVDGTDIYPNYTCAVTSISTEIGSMSYDDGTNGKALFFNISDANIPDDIDYSTCGIEGEIATIIFQSGMLAGREFQIETDENGKLSYDHKTRTFKLVSELYDGMYMPSWEEDVEGNLIPGKFAPAIGDKFNVYGISLPYGYIDGGVSMKGASWDLWRLGVESLHDEYTDAGDIKVEIDKFYLKENWSSLYNVLKIGNYICAGDNSILYKISSITETINDPYNIVCELTNGKIRTSLYTRTRIKDQLNTRYSRSATIAKVSEQKFKSRGSINKTTKEFSDKIDADFNLLEEKLRKEFNESLENVSTTIPVYFDFEHVKTQEGELTNEIEIVNSNAIESALQKLDKGHVPFARISEDQSVKFTETESTGTIVPIEIASWNNDSEFLRASLNFTYDDQRYVITINQESESVVSLSKVDRRTIKTEDIADGAVTNTKIYSRAVTTDKIADDAVTTQKIYSRAVTSEKIAKEAVTAEHIAPNTITEEHLTQALRDKINDDAGYVWAFKSENEVSQVAEATTQTRTTVYKRI